jgi:hypothetical protein
VQPHLDRSNTLSTSPAKAYRSSKRPAPPASKASSASAPPRLIDLVVAPPTGRRPNASNVRSLSSVATSRAMPRRSPPCTSATTTPTAPAFASPARSAQDFKPSRRRSCASSSRYLGRSVRSSPGLGRPGRTSVRPPGSLRRSSSRSRSFRGLPSTTSGTRPSKGFAKTRTPRRFGVRVLPSDFGLPHRLRARTDSQTARPASIMMKHASTTRPLEHKAHMVPTTPPTAA